MASSMSKSSAGIEGLGHASSSSSSPASSSASMAVQPLQQQQPRPWESYHLEIKTKSIEQTLIPLVSQITTLVNATTRGGGAKGGAMAGPGSAFRGERARRALSRVGRAVQAAVERFVLVGETIADDNPDIKLDMYEACREARAAGGAIEKLCDMQGDDVSGERTGMVRAARCLLAAVTQVLLLADTVVVKQLLLAKDKVSSSLTRLESVNNFTEFVKAFSHFGSEMVELAHLTGDRQNDLKDERRRSQMAAARAVLERSTLMLLTASKTCLRHPECPSARENRDTVFCQMRRAIDLIHYVIKDGVLDTDGSLCSSASSTGPSGTTGRAANGTAALAFHKAKEEDWDAQLTAHGALQQLEDAVEMTRLTLAEAPSRERMLAALDGVAERTQDFTDSAYTSHEHRESILLLCDRARSGVGQILKASCNLETRERMSPSEELETSIMAMLQATGELRQQLQQTAMEQAADLTSLTHRERDEGELVAALKNSALAIDGDRLDEIGERFQEHAEHVQEVCKLLRHVAPTEPLQVTAKYSELSLRIYGPQVLTAAHTLCLYPNSKIAKENFEVFADNWQSLINDIINVAREVAESLRGRAPEKQMYMSLPRPGRHGTTSKPLKPVKLDSEEQAKIAKAGLEMKLITSEMDAETERWTEAQTEAAGAAGTAFDENNDIVKRARNMSSMAFSMYQFTRGEGALKTTQDLFTQAEYFAEEANRLYKVVRQFSYQVPAGTPKKELLDFLDKVPTYVQQLQFTVKNPTVGKAATFTKVDNVIQETKNLMNVISKVVTTCFECATKYNVYMSDSMDPNEDGGNGFLPSTSIAALTNPSIHSRLAKYNLDFRGLSPRGRNMSPFRDGEEGSGASTSEGGKSGSGGGDPNI